MRPSTHCTPTACGWRRPSDSIAVEIFGYRDPATRDYAIDLGVALQLTNIVRDIAVDQRDGRLYLPLEDLDRFGLTESDLEAGLVTPKVRELLRFECERARTLLSEGARQAAGDGWTASCRGANHGRHLFTSCSARSNARITMYSRASSGCRVHGVP